MEMPTQLDGSHKPFSAGLYDSNHGIAGFPLSGCSGQNTTMYFTAWMVPQDRLLMYEDCRVPALGSLLSANASTEYRAISS